MVAAPQQSTTREQASTEPYAPLLARGISRPTLQTFSVSACVRHEYPYWRYPVRDAGGTVLSWRYKRAGDDPGRSKYHWAREGEPDPSWPGRRCPKPPAHAVYNISAVRAGQPAYVVAGEPDTWLMTTLGLAACSLLAGEGAVPAPAIQAIAARQPSAITVLYDHDEAGRKGARDVSAALRERGLCVRALALPADVGPKGDITDLYRLCDQDPQRFVAQLGALPDVPALEEKEPAGVRRASPQAGAPRAGASPIEAYKARHDLLAVAESSGVVLRSHQGGAYYQGRCPFHEDRSPSFVLWPQRGYWKCYGCGARGDVLDYVERLAGLWGIQP